MGQLPRALRRYLLVGSMIGVCALGASWTFTSDLSELSPLRVLVLQVLLLIVLRFPRHMLKGAKISLNTVPMFAAVLSLPVSIAVTMSVFGILVSEIFDRRGWGEVAFNSASTALEVFVGSMVYLGLNRGGLGISPLVTAAICAAAIYLTNVTSVTGAIAIQHGMAYRQVWWNVASTEVREHAAMYLAGGLLAVLLLVLPGATGPLLVTAVAGYMLLYWPSPYLQKELGPTG